MVLLMFLLVGVTPQKDGNRCFLMVLLPNKRCNAKLKAPGLKDAHFSRGPMRKSHKFKGFVRV